jgi:hypothetical protein
MRYKTIVFILFAVCVSLGLVSSIYFSQKYEYVTGDDFKSVLPVELSPVKQASTNPSKLRAELKGSIYESGEQVTVFGACSDGFGYLLSDANATFSSWYPNGTLWHNEVAMTPVLEAGNASGRFRIQMNMNDTMGTYLTQIKCIYGDDYALAFGEWQNPDWVKRIKDTQTSIESLTNLTIAQYNNITSSIQTFSSTVQINFSQVLNAIGGLNVSGDLGNIDVQLKEIYNQVHSLDTSFWVLDDEAPWYSYGSGVFDFSAVDMLSLNNIFAVSSDGYVVNWDGLAWSVVSNYSDILWNGVSVLQASIPYAWMAGSNTTSNTSVYSVNGGTPSTLPWSVGSEYLDVKLFVDPNSPSSNFEVYVLENNGVLWLSDDSGVSFTNPINFTCASAFSGRLSQIIENDDLGVTSGYRVGAAMCDDFIYYNGTGYEAYSVSDQVFTDVELVYNDLAYLISKDSVTDKLNVYKFDGNSLDLVYSVNDTTIEPRGIAAASTNDVWIVTNNPSVYYHYDGFKWEYYGYPYSGAIVIITFTNGTIPGLADISMYDSKNAYAVGTDGLIMKFYNIHDEQFDILYDYAVNISSIVNIINTSLSNMTFNVNLSEINTTINNIYSVVSEMNITFTGLFENLSTKIDLLNSSMTVRFDQVTANITYMQLYLNSTIYPMLTLILERLGVIETNVNETLRIVNESQITINTMNESLNELVNKSRKIHAWITQ